MSSEQLAFRRACMDGDYKLLISLDYRKIDINEHNSLQVYYVANLMTSKRLPLLHFLVTLHQKYSYVERLNIFLNDGWILHSAFQKGDLNLAKYIFSLEYMYGRDELEDNLHDCDECAFRYACESGHMHMIEYYLSLIPKYGYIEELDYVFEWSFHSACENNHLEVVKFLMSYKPPNQPNFKIDIHVGDDYAFYITRNFFIRRLLIKADPDYNWAQLYEYNLYRKTELKMIDSLMVMHYFISQQSEMAETEVLGIVVSYLV